MLVGTPRMLIEVRETDSTPSPLNLPGDLASIIVPATPAPAGIATTPFTLTECARLPVKESPGFAVLVSMLFLTRTTRLVPAGITSGGGGACAICCCGC